MNISPGSLGAVTQRMGGGYLNCHRGSAVWSQPCQHYGCKVMPPIFPSPCLEDSSPSTRCPLFPHHHTLEKLFRPNPEPGGALQTKPQTERSSLDQPFGPGEALQPNLWTSPRFPRQLPSTSLPANGSHARKEPPSPSHRPRTWLRGSIPFSQEVQDAPRACWSSCCSLPITHDPFAQLEKADQRPAGDQSSCFLRQVCYVANYIYILLLLQKEGMSSEFHCR